MAVACDCNHCNSKAIVEEKECQLLLLGHQKNERKKKKIQGRPAFLVRIQSRRRHHKKL